MKPLLQGGFPREGSGSGLGSHPLQGFVVLQGVYRFRGLGFRFFFKGPFSNCRRRKPPFFGGLGFRVLGFRV